MLASFSSFSREAIGEEEEEEGALAEVEASPRLAEHFLVSRLATGQEVSLHAVPSPVQQEAGSAVVDAAFVEAAASFAEEWVPGEEVPALFARPADFPQDVQRGPIADVCVIFPNQKEKIPSGWRCLVRTPFGFRGDCNSGVMGSEGVFLCFRHCAHIRPGDPTAKAPIVDIRLVLIDKEPVPKGYELVKTSRSGVLPANLNYGLMGTPIFLAVKRLPLVATFVERYHSLRPIMDLCIINMSKGETVPRGFEASERSTSEGNWTGNTMKICFRRASPIGMLDVSLCANLTDRVPRGDREKFSLPDEIATLIAPRGLQCLLREETNVPLPEFFSFVVTREDGSELHASCLKVFEPLEDTILKKLEKSFDLYLRIMKSRGDDVMIQRQIIASRAARQRTSLQGYKVYAPTALCILSRFPFHREFKQFLMLLYQMCISSSVIPLERYIGQLLFELPVPAQGSSGFVLNFAGQRKISFSLPPEAGFPVSSVNFETTFRCLGMKEFIQLFSLTLLEKKIILHSKHVAVLNEVASALRTLMFPLRWQNIYVPVCPDSLATLIAAPRSFIIGMHSDVFNAVPLTFEAEEEGWWEVALDEGRIYFLDALVNTTSVYKTQLDKTPPGGDPVDLYALVRSSTAQPPGLPPAIAKEMTRRLKDSIGFLGEDVGKGTRGGAGHQNPDMAYSLTPLEARGDDALRQIQMSVRDAAVRVMIELIGTYKDFLMPPRLAQRSLRHAEISPTNLGDIFDLNGFLQSLPRASRCFVTELSKTMHFTKFVDERTFSTQLSYRFLFFDALVSVWKEEPKKVVGLQKSFSMESRPSSSSSSVALTSSEKRPTFLVTKALERLDDGAKSRPISSQVVFEAGGGETVFKKLSQKMSEAFVLSMHNFKAENPWKDHYDYDHFPRKLNDTLLTTTQFGVLQNGGRRASGSNAQASRNSALGVTTTTSLVSPTNKSFGAVSTRMRSHTESEKNDRLTAEVKCKPDTDETAAISLHKSWRHRAAVSGIRLRTEKEASLKEMESAFALSDNGIPRARVCAREVIGSLLAMTPWLLSASGYKRQRFVLSLVLGAVCQQTAKHGQILDEAGTRGLLACCAICGPAFARDANTAFHRLVSSGCKPNALTYSYFTKALALRSESKRGSTQNAPTQWKTLKSLLWAFAIFSRVTKKKTKAMESMVPSSSGVRFIAIWTETRCAKCRSFLLDEHLLQGWMANEEQIALKCPICGFLVVPKLKSFEALVKGSQVEVVAKDGQCEYMSPAVLRHSTEEMIEVNASLMQRFSVHKMQEEYAALYLNFLWYAKRLGMPLLVHGEQKDCTMGARFSSIKRTVVCCTWKRFPFEDEDLILRVVLRDGTLCNSETNATLQGRLSDPFDHDGMNARTKPSSPLLRRASGLFERGVLMHAPIFVPIGNRHAFTRKGEGRSSQSANWAVVEYASPEAYFVENLHPEEEMRDRTLWGNRSLARDFIQFQELEEDDLFDQVSKDNSVSEVLKCLATFLWRDETMRAVRLFLSSRMASRHEEESEDHHEHNGFIVCRGWEIFSNSIYIELAALSRMIGKQDSPEMEIERAVNKALLAMDQIDPTLASYVSRSDFAPRMSALASRHVFGLLYP